jgi:hypothetical protein
VSDGLPYAKNMDEFMAMTPEQQATLIAAHQVTWLGRTTPGSSISPMQPREITEIMIRHRTVEDEAVATAGWKQNPTEEELASFRANDWK